MSAGLFAGIVTITSKRKVVDYTMSKIPKSEVSNSSNFNSFVVRIAVKPFALSKNIAAMNRTRKAP